MEIGATYCRPVSLDFFQGTKEKYEEFHLILKEDIRL
jgi:hypothetical protein